MKNFSFLFFLFIGLSASLKAQHILKSDIIYNGDLHTTDYIFVPSESKMLEKDWKIYLSKTGNISEDKGQFTSKISSSDLSRNLDKIVSYVQDHKTFSAVHIILLDENDRSLAASEINNKALESFLYEFYDLAYLNEEIRMAETDLTFTEKLKDDAEKSQSRAERNLTANLKAQVKLGKKLDETPEKLSQIITEKDEVYQKLLQTNGSDEPTEEGELKKELSKTDKKIVKTKTYEERNAGKLTKKEAEFEELSDNLFTAREDLVKATQVLESKKVVLQDLTKK